MRANRRRLLTVLTVGAAIGCLTWLVASAGATSARFPVGTATRLPLFTAVNGKLPASTRLRLSIALKPRNESKLQNVATAVATPGSPLFRHYLTAFQFARRFGASRSAITAVTRTLRASGLDVGSVSANDLLIPVTGSTQDIDHAFNAELEHVDCWTAAPPMRT